MNLDFKNMEIYRWFLIGGGGLAVLSVLLYFVKGSRIRVSAFFACFIGCLALGFGAGVITLGALGYNWNKKEVTEGGPAPEGAAPMNDGPKMPMKGGFPGKNKKGGVNVKTQLATLITKLSLLTEAPLSISLNDERKKKIGDLLESLGAKETLDDNEAAKALLALQEIIESDRKTMDAVGYSWFTGSADSVPAKDSANPFAEGGGRTALSALLSRVGKKVPEPKPKAALEVGPEPRLVDAKGAN